MYQVSCKHFSGYKPCAKNKNCNEHCPQKEVPQSQVLIIHLEALGAVLRATSLLRSIKKKHPQCSITWVTKAPADQLLLNNPLIDRVYTLKPEDLLELSTFEFDVTYCIDKSLTAVGVLKHVQTDICMGFKSNGKGAIIPSNSEANYLWSLGLENQKKFFENKKTEVQLMLEAFNLYEEESSPYVLCLSSDEKKLASQRRAIWKTSDGPVIGINTGCAATIPHKKWTVEFQRELVKSIYEHFHVKPVLLGGPEDTKRNELIGYNRPVIQSPTKNGLRDGLASIEACDIVITGDSLGMHMGIALKKWVVAWFGATCAHEIDLYGHGVKLEADVNCSPCWKRSCDKQNMCYDQVSLSRVIDAIKKSGLFFQNSHNLKNL